MGLNLEIEFIYLCHGVQKSLCERSQQRSSLSGSSVACAETYDKPRSAISSLSSCFIETQSQECFSLSEAHYSDVCFVFFKSGPT